MSTETKNSKRKNQRQKHITKNDREEATNDDGRQSNERNTKHTKQKWPWLLFCLIYPPDTESGGLHIMGGEEKHRTAATITTHPPTDRPTDRPRHPLNLIPVETCVTNRSRFARPPPPCPPTKTRANGETSRQDWNEKKPQHTALRLSSD